MLVLNDKEVKYCRLLNPDADLTNSYLEVRLLFSPYK